MTHEYAVLCQVETLESLCLLSSVSGVVFQDENGDGFRQAGESGAAGRTVYLDANDNSVLNVGETFVLTDSNGQYTFSGLAAGTYNVRQVLLSGWTQTSPVPGTMLYNVDFNANPLGAVLTQPATNTPPLPRPSDVVTTAQSTAQVVNSFGDLTDKPVLLQGISSSGNTDDRGEIVLSPSTPLSSGKVVLRWQSAISSMPVVGDWSAALEVRFAVPGGGVSEALALKYDPHGWFDVNANSNQTEASFTPGIANAFELEIDVTAKTHTLRVDGESVSADAFDDLGDGIAQIAFNSFALNAATSAPQLAVDNITLQSRPNNDTSKGKQRVTLDGSTNVSGAAFAVRGPHLKLDIPHNTLLEGRTYTASVIRSQSSSSPVSVTLSCDNPGVTLPSTVTIPANQATVLFPISVPTDKLFSGDTRVSIVASAAGLMSSKRVLIREDEYVDGTLSTQQQVDTALIPLAAGESLTIGSSYSLGPALELLDPQARLLQLSDDGTGMTYRAPATGVYSLRISSAHVIAPFTGEYRIYATRNRTLAVEDTEPNDSTPQSLPVGMDTFHGVLSGSGDVDHFSFSGSPGQTVGLRFLNLPALNPRIKLLAPNGSVVSENGSGLGLLASLATAGTYVIEVSSQNLAGTVVGDYLGSVNLVSNAISESAVAAGFVDAPSISLVSTPNMAVGVLSDLQDVDLFRFHLDGLQAASANFISLSGQTGRQLKLFNSSGQYLASSTDTNGVDDLLRIEMAGFRSGVPLPAGDYFLAVNAPGATGLGPYEIGISTTGSFPNQRDVPLLFIDSTGQMSHFGEGPAAFSHPEVVAAFEAMIRSHFSPYDLDVTDILPPAGSEYISLGIGDFGATSFSGIGAPLGSGGIRRPVGHALVDYLGATYFGSYSWNSLNTHELGHAFGQYHARQLLAALSYQGGPALPVGSYFPFYADETFAVPAVTNSRLFLDTVMQPGRRTPEAEPNGTPQLAQDLTPLFAEMSTDADVRNDRVSISGDIADDSDTDTFRVTASAGQSLAFDIDAAEFQSPLDAYLTILDSDGKIVTSNRNALDHESGLDSVDPYLTWTFAEADTYFVQVRSERNTSGFYYLKATPTAAFERHAPRVITTLPQGGSQIDGTRQIVFVLDDQLDPATLASQNIVVQGATTGVRNGQALFDPMATSLIWTADAQLPPDVYTITLRSGANGLRDLHGNPLDGETSGVLIWPNISGDETAGGDFVTQLTVTQADSTTAVVFDPVRFNATPYNRAKFDISLTDDASLGAVTDASLRLRAPGPDHAFETSDDLTYPLDVSSFAPEGTTYVTAYTRGIPQGGESIVLSGGGNARAIASGDFDNDGLLDVLTADYGSSQVFLRLGRGDGTFSSGGFAVVGNRPTDVVTADVNGDGNLDAVTSDLLGQSATLLLGNGDGTFQTVVAIPLGTDAVSVTVGDVNQDGRRDIVVAETSTQSVAVVLQQLDGSWVVQPVFALGFTPGQIALVDLNRDSRLDLIVADDAGHGQRLLGNGDGTFQAGATITSAAWNQFTSADFNGDGKIDMAVSWDSNSDVNVVFGDGNGGFANAVSYTVPGQDGPLAVADVTGDGRLDLIVGHRSGASNGGSIVAVLPGLQNGMFTPPEITAVGSSLADIAVGDFNQDGRDDVLELFGFTSGILLTQTADGRLIAPDVFRIDGTLTDAAGRQVSFSKDVYLNRDAATSPRTLSISDISIHPNTFVSAQTRSIDVSFSESVDLSTLTPGTFRVWYSPNVRFFDGDDTLLTDADGTIAWDPTHLAARFETAQPLAPGRYLVELLSGPDGIKGRDGRPLDGEYLDGGISGNTTWAHWTFQPSGNSMPGGDFRSVFSVLAVPTGVWGQVATTVKTAVNSVSITFSKPMQTVARSEFTLNGTNLNSLAGVSVSSNGNVCTVSGLSPYTATGNPNTTYTLAVVSSNTIRDLEGNSLSGLPTVTWRMDTTVPSTTSFTRKTPAKTPTNADKLVFLATFSEPVTGVAASDFAVTGATGTISVLQISSSTYEVTITGGNLAGLNGTVGLNFKSPTIVDLAGNILPGGEPSVDQTYTLDNAVATVTDVTSTKANGAYKAGTVIDVTVRFSEAVTVTGTPRIRLETGATDRTADYLSGSGTSLLKFRYTVQGGDKNSDLNYTSTTSLFLNGGVIRDGALNNAALTLPTTSAAGSLGMNKALVIDTAAPTVTDVTSTKANGTYKAGTVIDVMVTFSEAVTVSGTPYIRLETGTTDEAANYLSGSGASTLIFRYTVQAGDNSSNLNYTSMTALAFNGGAIRDIALNSAALTLPATSATGSLGRNKNLVIDTVVPTVTNVTSAKANGTYGTGTVIDVIVKLSESATVTGTPQIRLETGTTDRTANYLSGSGTSTLTFRYTVQAGDTSSDLNYTSTTALFLNGGTMRDLALNNATLSLPATAAAGSLGVNKVLVIDTITPQVTNVTSTKPNGAYTTGTVIDVTVTFNEMVVVAGLPQVRLETGATDRTASYLSGSGTSTLTFRYTVQAGDKNSDLNYTSTTALFLNGGTIRDLALNNATLSLPATAAAGSLGVNKNLRIDTSAAPAPANSLIAIAPQNSQSVLRSPEGEEVTMGSQRIIGRPTRMVMSTVSQSVYEDYWTTLSAGIKFAQDGLLDWS